MSAKDLRSQLHSLRPEDDFPVLSNPEFLAEGSAIKNLLHPDRVLIGAPNSSIGRQAASRLAALYQSWIPSEKILHTNVWSSELAKLVANALLAQRISSINSISALCERTGADVREIARAVGTDDRIGSKFLKAGLGFGGSCFRKDISSLVYIASSLNLPEVADYWRAVLDINTYQRDRFSEKIVQRLNNTLIRKKVTLLGFAYKSNTGDTRESLAVDVIKALTQERPGEIAIFDPCCPKEGIERELVGIDGVDKVKIYQDIYKACEGASAIAVLTEWDIFKCDSLTKQKPQGQGPASQKQDLSPAEAPLKAFVPPQEQPCQNGCADCTSDVHSKTLLEGDWRMDWTRVVKDLKEPRYILDGRGILDEQVMQQLGVRVEGLGWGSVFFTNSDRW
jgi:UDPglucose 6-dehydrogenase